MKVNKNSWHYKALTGETLGLSGADECIVSNSLCLYFWQVVYMIMYKAGILLLGVPVALFMLVVLPLTSLAGLIVTGNMVEGDLGLIILFLEVVFTFTVFVDNLVYKVHKDYQHKKRVKEWDEPVEKEPNLVVEYIKAKKEKLCPMLEFVEESTDETK